MSKVCRQCGERQNLAAFIADARYKGGHRHQCRKCLNAYYAAVRAAAPKPPQSPKPPTPPEVLAERAERRRKYQREWRANWRKANPERAREEWRKYETPASDFLTAWRNN